MHVLLNILNSNYRNALAGCLVGWVWMDGNDDEGDDFLGIRF